MQPTRVEALNRLAEFLPRAGRDYRATRNEDRGAADRTNVSMLAPYIRARLITEEEVVRAVLERHSFAAAQKFIQEVFWRTYWKGWLESRPSVWSDYRAALDACYARLASDAQASDSYAAAVAGRTGIGPFDAWAHELVTTGYLHNHARMWFASIWTFTLGLPWELGADFFMRHLLCGDPASNTLSWRWVAGLHTKGRTYRATRHNILRYTFGRLDPGDRLAVSASPCDGPAYSAAELPALTTLVGGMEPALLLLHDDDAGAESLALGGIPIPASVALCAVTGRSPQAVGAPVVAFARAALVDGLSRAPGAESPVVYAADDPAEAAVRILEQARRYSVSRIVTPYAPIGPVRDALTAIEPLLAAGGVRVAYLVRPYDAEAWPFATRGFFNLKDKIPTVLSKLGIDAQAV